MTDRTIYYTGIGSRNIPTNIFDTFYGLGQVLGETYQGEPVFVLRSGGASGADTAFERGCDSRSGEKQIFLPWKGFNKNDSPYFEIPEQAFAIAKDVYGKYWNRLKPATKKFMARNVQQILGPDLDCESSLVVCWTPDGCTTEQDRSRKTGGTGQAIALASRLDIPVFNLYNPNDIYRLHDLFEEIVND